MQKVLKYRGFSDPYFPIRTRKNSVFGNFTRNKRAVDSFDWSKAFENVDLDTQVEIFHGTVLNIINNFTAKKINFC